MDLQKQYDVIIAGGGPAASALSMYADEKLRVLVVEKRHLLDPSRMYEREKCCGGMLDATAQKTLTRMHLSLPEEVIMAPQVFSVRAVDMVNNMERTYQRNYVNIDRVQLDAMLLRKAAARPNVDVLEGAVLYDFEENEEGVTVKVRLADTADQMEIGCRMLVGADGAFSAVRRTLMKLTGEGPVCPPKTYVSMQEWFEVDQPLPYYMAIFDNKVTDYYSWVIPKKNQILVGSAMPEKYGKMMPADRFDRLKADLSEKGLDLSRPVRRLGSTILRPHTFGSVWTGCARVFLIGEAAGLISPSSSEGISFALRSGIQMAKAMNSVAGSSTAGNSTSGGEADLVTGLIRLRYEKNLRGLKASIALKTFKSPLMYDRWLRGIIFLSRLTSIEPASAAKKGGGSR